MSFFLSTDEFSIYKNKEKYSYTLNFNKSSKSVMESIIKTKLITSSIITNNYKSLLFNALSVQTLEEFQKQLLERNKSKRMSYDISLKMVLSLSKQLKYLLTNTDVCFYKYDAKNILVIDEEIFIYLSNEDLTEREDEHLLISYPFSFNDNYLSPELENIKHIPYNIHYRSIYYSLGLLVADCLSEDDDSRLINLKGELLLVAIENTIGQSKLYYFLSRCLDKEIQKRSLLYV